MKTFGSKLQNIFGNNTENRLNSIRDFDDNSEECVAMEYDNDDDDSILPSFLKGNDF